MKAGLTSITFRNKSIEEIVGVTKKAGLSSIEWGGDVHCPPDKGEFAKLARELCEKNGIAVSSYGTYFRLGNDTDEEFEKICENTKLLGTDTLRIWGYNKDCEAVSDDEYEKCISQAKRISKIAQKHGFVVCFEYHRGTLTRKAEFAKKLIEDINCENIRLYWQPNPEISADENRRELSIVLPYVVNIHCFAWTWDGKNVRHPLSDGRSEWKKYIEIAKKGNVGNILIEFVKDDDDMAFEDDAKTLCEILK